MSNPMGRESRIFGQKTLRAAQGHSRVSGKRQSVSCRVSFPFFLFRLYVESCGQMRIRCKRNVAIPIRLFLVFGNKMSSNSVFRMLKILFGERLELGFKSCDICIPFVLRTSENRFQPNDFSIS